MRALGLVVLVVVPLGAGCGAPVTTTPTERGAVEPLAAGSSWKTLGSVTGAAIEHFWGVRDDYEFSGRGGALRKTSAGAEVLAWGINSTQQDAQHHLLRFSFDATFKSTGVVRWLTTLERSRPRDVRFSDAGLWLWSTAAGGSTSVSYSTLPAPQVEGEPSTAISGGFNVTPNPTDARAFLDERLVPWFAFASGFQVFTPISEAEKQLAPAATKKAYTCGRCSDLRPGREGVVSGSDPFVHEGRVYWPAFGQSPSLLAPSRLVMFRSEAMPSGAVSTPWTFLEEVVASSSDVPLDFDDYTWFRAHRVGGLAYLTWLGPSKASQVVFDVAAGTFTVRAREVPLTGFDATKLTHHQFDDAGDLVFVQSAAEGATVHKLTPAGLAQLGEPVRFSTTWPEGTPKRTFRVDGLALFEGLPVLLVVGNGFTRVEPQLSLVTLP